MIKLFPLLCCILVTLGLQAQNDSARLMRFPTIHDDQVVFSYAGDLYSVNKSGGYATRLTSDPGYEMFARFSPDGKNIAFTGQYDGNTEVYLIPSTGGEPRRITYTATLGRDNISDRMGPNNIIMTWKDNQHVVYRSRNISFNDFQGQLYLADVNGDMPQQLPFPKGGFCSYSPDGSQLAMNQVFREFRTWKYYEGGMADDIWIYDFASKQITDITNDPHQDIEPMWAGNKIYFLSDRDHTMNLFCYDVTSKQVRKVTNYTDYDIKFPSLGNNAIVWERAGYLWYMDLATETVKQIPVQIAGDFLYSRTELIDATKFAEGTDLSPDGNRMLLVGRGDIFTIPAKEGITRNLTQTSGAHERSATWSPDGKYIAYISDASGEDEIYLRPQDGSGDAIQITSNGDVYKYLLNWSPDSKKIMWSDKKLRLQYVDIDSKKITVIDNSTVFEFNDYTWSPDSKWVAYVRPEKQDKGRILLYNLESKSQIAATDGWFNSYQPSFSDDGKYLCMVSDRDFSPSFSQADFNASYFDMARVYILPLSKETASPFLGKNDEVKSAADKGDADKKSDTAKSKDVRVDADGLVDRLIGLPIAHSGYYNVTMTGNHVYYMNRGNNDDASTLKMFDVTSKEETDIAKVDNYQVSVDHKKVMLQKGDDYYITDLPASKMNGMDGKVDLSNCKVWVNKHEEWNQIFTESWRQMRDFFAAPNMNGANWKGVYNKYHPLVKYVNNRNDLTYLIGEMISELNSGHSYTGGGDAPKTERIKMGMLGAQFSKDQSSGYFTIDKILAGADWDPTLRSPLTEVGLNIHGGDYILAINGKATNTVADIYQLLIDQADKDVELSINSKPTLVGARKVIVKPVASEANLYYYNWVEHNIHYVDSVSQGKVGYIHIPDMGEEGLNMFMKLFYPQINKAALIIDDRGNGGGFVSPLITERLSQQIVFWDILRNAEPTPDPEMHWGPKVCLINEYSASDGDIFPYRFKTLKLGKVIGKRSWGGVVGIRGSLPFVDGGFLDKPEFSRFDVNGNWCIESHGVDPDIEVANDPAQEFMGNDQQLNKGIDEVLSELKNWPKQPPVPAWPVRTK